jgi:membrane-bound inhibitor of C-type lysozyme
VTPVRKLLALLPFLAPAVPLLALAACGGGLYDEGSPSPVNVSYACEDGRTVVVRYFDHSATVRLPDGPAVETTRQQGGPADRFAGGGIVWSVESGDGMLDTNGRRVRCKRKG